MEKRKLNWPLWAGSLSAIIAFFSYFLFFAKFPITRDFPWANFLLFALAGTFLAVGLRRAFARPPSYGGKISGPLLTILSAAVLGFFCYSIFVESRDLPSAAGAPDLVKRPQSFHYLTRVGRRCPWRSYFPLPLQLSPDQGVLQEVSCSSSTGAIGDPSVTPSCGVSSKICTHSKRWEFARSPSA